MCPTQTSPPRRRFNTPALLLADGRSERTTISNSVGNSDRSALRVPEHVPDGRSERDAVRPSQRRAHARALLPANGSSERGSVGSPDRAALRGPQRRPDAGTLRRACRRSLRRTLRRTDRRPGSRVRLSLLPGARRCPVPNAAAHVIRFDYCVETVAAGGGFVGYLGRAFLRDLAGEAAHCAARRDRWLEGGENGPGATFAAAPRDEIYDDVPCTPTAPRAYHCYVVRGGLTVTAERAVAGALAVLAEGMASDRYLSDDRPNLVRVEYADGARRVAPDPRLPARGPRASPGADWTLAAACCLLLASVALALFVVRARDATGDCSSRPPSGRYPRRGRRARRERRRPAGRAATAPRSERWRRNGQRPRGERGPRTERRASAEGAARAKGRTLAKGQTKAEGRAITEGLTRTVGRNRKEGRKETEGRERSDRLVGIAFAIKKFLRSAISNKFYFGGAY